MTKYENVFYKNNKLIEKNKKLKKIIKELNDDIEIEENTKKCY